MRLGYGDIANPVIEQAHTTEILADDDVSSMGDEEGSHSSMLITDQDKVTRAQLQALHRPKESSDESEQVEFETQPPPEEVKEENESTAGVEDPPEESTVATTTENQVEMQQETQEQTVEEQVSQPLLHSDDDDDNGVEDLPDELDVTTTIASQHQLEMQQQTQEQTTEDQISQPLLYSDDDDDNGGNQDNSSSIVMPSTPASPGTRDIPLEVSSSSDDEEAEEQPIPLPEDVPLEVSSSSEDKEADEQTITVPERTATPPPVHRTFSRTEPPIVVDAVFSQPMPMKDLAALLRKRKRDRMSEEETRFTPEEDAAVLEGVREHGEGQWAKILTQDERLDNRSTSEIRNRYQALISNMQKRKKRDN